MQQGIVIAVSCSPHHTMGGEVRPGDPIHVELPAPPHRALEPV